MSFYFQSMWTLKHHKLRHTETDLIQLSCRSSGTHCLIILYISIQLTFLSQQGLPTTSVQALPEPSLVNRAVHLDGCGTPQPWSSTIVSASQPLASGSLPYASTASPLVASQANVSTGMSSLVAPSFVYVCSHLLVCHSQHLVRPQFTAYPPQLILPSLCAQL